MNRCDDVREQLEDVALGSAITPALRDHLAECDSCTAELERQRALAGRIDDAVGAVVRAEPPPELLAGVAARLASPRVATWSAVRPRIVAWVAAAACAVIFALSFRALERPSAHRAELSALTAWRSPTVSLLQPRGFHIDLRPSPLRTSGGSRGS